MGEQYEQKRGGEGNSQQQTRGLLRDPCQRQNSLREGEQGLVVQEIILQLYPGQQGGDEGGEQQGSRKPEAGCWVSRARFEGVDFRRINLGRI